MLDISNLMFLKYRKLIMKYMDSYQVEFDQETQDDILMSEPQIDSVTLNKVRECQDIIEKYEPMVKKAKEERDEWTAHLLDDPYFRNGGKIPFAEYKLEIGVTKPTEMNDKYFQDKLEKHDIKRQEILEEWDNIKHGEYKTKSTARVFVKSIKIK